MLSASWRLPLSWERPRGLTTDANHQSRSSWSLRNWRGLPRYPELSTVHSPSEDTKIHLDADSSQNGTSTQKAMYENPQDIATGQPDLEGIERKYQQRFSRSSAFSNWVFETTEVDILGLGITLTVMSIVIIFCEFSPMLYINWRNCMSSSLTGEIVCLVQEIRGCFACDERHTSNHTWWLD